VDVFDLLAGVKKGPVLADAQLKDSIRLLRMARGWDQMETARQLVRLVNNSMGRTVITVATLRTMIVKWESGAEHPAPRYYDFLATLFDSAPEVFNAHHQAAGSAVFSSVPSVRHIATIREYIATFGSEVLVAKSLESSRSGQSPPALSYQVAAWQVLQEEIPAVGANAFRKFIALNIPGVVPMFLDPADDDHYYRLNVRAFGYRLLSEVSPQELNIRNKRKIIAAVRDVFTYRADAWFLHNNLNLGNVFVLFNEIGELADVKIIGWDEMEQLEAKNAFAILPSNLHVIDEVDAFERMVMSRFPDQINQSHLWQDTTVSPIVYVSPSAKSLPAKSILPTVVKWLVRLFIGTAVSSFAGDAVAGQAINSETFLTFVANVSGLISLVFLAVMAGLSLYFNLPNSRSGMVPIRSIRKDNFPDIRESCSKLLTWEVMAGR
jgi:hypothetical protein